MTQLLARFFSQGRVGQYLLILFAATVLYGCGGRPIVPVYEPGPKPRYPEPKVPEVIQQPAAPKDWLAGPAAPLYRKAKNSLDQKDYIKAELVMERELRVEPNYGYYWYMLAKIKFAEKQYGRMVQLCLKSKSLAGGDTRLIQLNEQLMAKSR